MKPSIKRIIKSIPFFGDAATRINRKIRSYKRENPESFSSRRYWEKRYQSNLNSGAGSYHRLAEFKAEILNDFVKNNDIFSVVEFGCGDGNQLKFSNYPYYVGYDVSVKSIEICNAIFKNNHSKKFYLIEDYNGKQYDLSISLDVIYHLIEESVFYEYMERLFDSSKKFVIIYSSNTDDQSLTSAIHVKHRCFTSWIEKYRPNWKMICHIPNRFPYNGSSDTSFADFYIYEKLAP